MHVCRVHADSPVDALPEQVAEGLACKQPVTPDQAAADVEELITRLAGARLIEHGGSPVSQVLDTLPVGRASRVSARGLRAHAAAPTGRPPFARASLRRAGSTGDRPPLRSRIAAHVAVGAARIFAASLPGASSPSYE